MPASLKKGTGTLYLLPIVGAYMAGVTVLGLGSGAIPRSLLQPLSVAGLASVLVLVFQELIPRSVKEVLVFWRLRERVPGYRAFSTIARRDTRIDLTELAVLLPDRPLSAAEQNALWYRWLKAVEQDPAIADNHRRFLVLRDCAVLLFLLTVVSLGGVVLDVYRGLILAGVCFGLYLLMAVAARNSAGRLVGNVIARKVATS